VAWLSARHISERELLDALAREARIAQARHELRSLTSRLLPIA
jgi:hypothetical protein